ncbi:PTS system D-glucosamine-specific IIB component, Glc family / PTS system D-glucosamine-specific IIC component, Glc family / PTS system D-glucosamine-specific IIA component, Glc family [Desulforamulus reducens MI-1]|uniref:PTS system D-glucosamine-specific IIB component, Glc family / PTS system D-glucosamine-specific IIC component, Glc family / PTS system D-glucosamine-specific IIA component, Glc family n=1 Tax=Desulforamulus reducens (strain ATCC BAA-1160 / DSM 100696 / MI-1) TaxID=349161 RepID=A4J1C7_DESRM|nr:glucose PTS transporter subunit IIA [Desulforamulus reducens]ABO48880.1 PTS system D-glucosamine-specific IIB component, Glc family / PTS system D-glucosamine-specific IIC component, Glc family / PTS system D-glucosamine-specific IIA component, Glc family [Desulforamulus reducens MI-1]
MKKAFKYLQMVGQSLMLPVSVLPAAGLLLRFGEKDLLNMPAMKEAGLAIFANLPLIFAVGVAIGFSGGQSVAALAAVVGQLILLAVLKAVDPSINMGVFSGIIMGITAALLYKRFYQIKLPQYLGFFAGKRFVPIITAVAGVVIALISAVVWPSIQNVIDAVGQVAVSSSFGPALFAAGKRLLIPVGLHHVYYPSFLYEFGQYVTAAGEIVKGDFNRYFAGDPTAGTFMASEFPIMMFGLPAAAFAIYRNARPERKKAIAGLMASAAFTSFLTGITEPIEFSFIFVAPVLFVFHVLMAGVSGFVTNLLDIHLGFTFSASFIDYLLSYKYGHNQLLLWPVGLVVGGLYFVVFNTAIKMLNLKTPGREDEITAVENQGTGSDLAHKVLDALGGANNIEILDACITRLRVTVKDPDMVKKDVFKALGASGVMEMGKNLQIIFGTQSDSLKEEIRSLMTNTVSATAEGAKPLPELNVSASKTMIKAPASGKVIPLEQVPDETFKQKLLGNGVAIEPVEGTFIAPVAGTVVQVFPTNHALTIKTENGIEILLHVGINTVSLKGQGFKALVSEGQKVTVGQKLLEVDLKQIEKAGLSTITPVIIIGSEDMEITPANEVTSGEDTILQI